MLREFACIGLSRYTGQTAAGELIGRLLRSGEVRGHHYYIGNKLMVELVYEMGPFQLVMRGEKHGLNMVTITSVMPALKEKRGYGLGAPEVFRGPGGVLYLEGSDRETMETMTLALTEISPYYRDGAAFDQPMVRASCYGMSTEGKVLLGIERTEEDLAAIREETAYRRNMLRQAGEGREDARAALRSYEFDNEDEVIERLKNEDVYSIFDGFYYPAEKDDNCFTLLGDILQVEKLMNPLSEEWVYYLDLNVLGQVLRVLVHPQDLVGQPAKGRRFQGKVRFYGRLNPGRMLLENQTKFF